MFEGLSDEGVKKIIDWLAEHQIETSLTKLHRDFSDGVHVAKILKKIYPRMVELNNYPKYSSTTQKMNNWETLNFKVLNKIGLSLNTKRMRKLAESKPGAIEALLYQLMLKDYEVRRSKNVNVSIQEQLWTENDDIVITKVKQSIDGEIVENPQKLILLSIYDDACRESSQLSKQIAAMEQKIAHLENLKQLKIDHIKEVTARMSSLYGPESTVEPGDDISVPSLDLKEIVNSENKSTSDSSSLNGTSDSVLTLKG